MHLADLNWMDVEQYLQHDDRIIVITGATEQHAYLSLLTDVRIPEAIAAGVAQRESVLVAPPLNFGCSAYFMEYPGTITFSEETFALALTDIVKSLMQHGFGGFLILNGHGGNAMPEELAALEQELEEIRIIWYDWWRSERVQTLAAQIQAAPDHANWVENFRFTRVAEIPQGEKPLPDFALLDTGYPAREILGDGSFGGHYQMPDEVMDQLLALVVDEAAELVQML